MKIKSLLILGLLVVTASYFVGRDDTLPETSISQQELIKQPTPDELWEKQQQQQQAAVSDVSEATALESEKEVIKPTTKPIDMKKPVIVKQTIPTPDELWEQQHQVNSESFLPSDTPEIQVVPQEMLEAEAEARTRNVANANSDTDVTNEEWYDDLIPNDAYSQLDEQAANEPEIEVLPIELVEAEMSYQNRGTQAYAVDYQEPLVDPETGLSEEDLMNYAIYGNPVESETPVDDFTLNGDQQ